MMIDMTVPFGFGCLFWDVVLMAAVLVDRDAFVKENKPRWKVAVLAAVLLLVGAACFACRFL